MSSVTNLIILFMIAIIAANLPFLTERRLLVFQAGSEKPFWLRLLEWFLMYLAVMGVAIGMEVRMHGAAYKPVWEVWNFSQHWEFYSITVCLFVVFAMPGFLYHYDLKRFLK
jgi:hypothetical protein